jgi:hypothetical protein
MGLDALPVKGMAAGLVLDKILPETLHKVIYLDGDILVFGSLQELWQKLPKENYAIAGIGDSCPDPVTFQSQAILDRLCELYLLAVTFKYPSLVEKLSRKSPIHFEHFAHMTGH